MNDWPRVDFAQLVREVTDSPLIGRDALAIWGGFCPESALTEFLGAWDLREMPYRIWEFVSEIVFERGTMPGNVALLERGRLFGPGGDLELRREGDGFAWRFIGPAGTAPPPAAADAQDYWAHHPDATFFQRTETALLWGTRRSDAWYDDRVGAARLNYPGEGERLQVRYKTFSRAGQVEFVWLTELSPWEEAENV